MLKRKRHERVDESRVGVYLVSAYTVRGAFLTGIDRYAVKSFTYRESWIDGRVPALGEVFAVECLDYRTLDTVLHLVLRNRPDVAAEWSNEEVARRWLRLNRAKLRLRDRLDPDRLAATLANPAEIAKHRSALASISFYMAYLRQPIGVLANEEDGERGFFWEPRFGCRRLPDDPETWRCELYLPTSRFKLVVDDE